MNIVENGLIPVMENENGEKLVNARNLHEFLEAKTEFKDWIKRRLDECDAIEDEDFSSFLSESTGGRPSREYILKLDIAKEISMLEKNQKGKQIRRYFIAVEKKAKEKQFESIDHLKKEQMMLEFTMDKLKINDGSKVKMISKFNKAHNLSTEYLPNYTEENITKSLSELLKQCQARISAVKMNQTLIKLGILEEKERPSKGKGIKKYKSLTDKGLKYGKNLISTHGNQTETQPHYFEDTFAELLELVSEIS